MKHAKKFYKTLSEAELGRRWDLLNSNFAELDEGKEDSSVIFIKRALEFSDKNGKNYREKIEKFESFLRTELAGRGEHGEGKRLAQELLEMYFSGDQKRLDTMKRSVVEFEKISPSRENVSALTRLIEETADSVMKLRIQQSSRLLGDKVVLQIPTLYERLAKGNEFKNEVEELLGPLGLTSSPDVLRAIAVEITLFALGSSRESLMGLLEKDLVFLRRSLGSGIDGLHNATVLSLGFKSIGPEVPEELKERIKKIEESIGECDRSIKSLKETEEMLRSSRRDFINLGSDLSEIITDYQFASAFSKGFKTEPSQLFSEYVKVVKELVSQNGSKIIYVKDQKELINTLDDLLRTEVVSPKLIQGLENTLSEFEMATAAALKYL